VTFIDYLFQIAEPKICHAYFIEIAAFLPFENAICTLSRLFCKQLIFNPQENPVKIDFRQFGRLKASRVMILEDGMKDQPEAGGYERAEMLCLPLGGKS
jgi:hypothetical protein